MATRRDCASSTPTAPTTSLKRCAERPTSCSTPSFADAEGSSSLDPDHHRVGADERHDAGLPEAGVLHPPPAVRPRVVEAAGRLDEHVEAHQKAERVLLPIVV